MREVFFTGSSYVARVNISVPHDSYSSIVTAGRSLLMEEGLGSNFVADPNLYYLVSPGNMYADSFATTNLCEIDKTIYCNPKHVRHSWWPEPQCLMWLVVSEINIQKVSASCFAVSGRDIVKVGHSVDERRDKAVVDENVSRQNISLLTISDPNTFEGSGIQVREMSNENERTKLMGKNGEVDKEVEKICTLEVVVAENKWDKDVVQFRGSDGRLLGKLQPSIQDAYGQLLKNGTNFECTIFRRIYEQIGSTSFGSMKYDVLVKWVGPSISHPTPGTIRSIGLGGGGMNDGGFDSAKQAAFEQGVWRG